MGAVRLAGGTVQRMDKSESSETLLAAEREILRALCQSAADGLVRKEGMALLGDYAFRDNVHQLVFDAVLRLRQFPPGVLREQLPIRLNNLGFPDLDLDVFFQPPILTDKQVMSRMRALRIAASGKRQRGAPAS